MSIAPSTLAAVVLRMVHIMAAIVWIGHIYVNMALRPRFVPLPAKAAPGSDDPEFLTRSKLEHAVFRYASIVTWLAGGGLLWHSNRLVSAFTLSGYDAVIGTGAWIGTVMTLNVWLVLWPHQKKVLGFVPASYEERARCARITFLSSRTNAMLSVPLMFFMTASSFGASLF